MFIDALYEKKALREKEKSFLTSNFLFFCQSFHNCLWLELRIVSMKSPSSLCYEQTEFHRTCFGFRNTLTGRIPFAIRL